MVTLNPAAEGEDRYINTWHFINAVEGAETTAATAFQTALNNFYQAIDTHYSATLASVVPSVKFYDMSDPKPRVPFQEGTMSALSTGSGTLPTEVALCLSYRAEMVSGGNPRRRRGRIYLGPFASSAGDTSTGRPTAACLLAVQTAAQVLIDASQASTDYEWVVYSRADDPAETGTGTAGRPVVAGYVDAAWDTQRRRGLDSGTRSTFS